MKKQFDLKKFETLKTSNDTLKGGFSTALSSTGGRNRFDLELNVAANCGTSNQCTINNVAGCGAKK